ncbi:MAG: hypothetical protein QXG25_00430 [Nitrososphaerota archaeon]
MTGQHLKIPFIIGAGSGGSRIVSKIMVAGAQPTLIGINSSWKDLDALDNIVKVRAGGGDGSGMDPKRGEKDYLSSRERFFEVIEKVLEERRLSKDDVDVIPVIISAGHGFGTGSGPRIVEDLKKMFRRTPILAFITLPFAFEGELTMRKAVDCLKKVSELTGTIPISNQHVASLLGPEESIKVVLAKVNAYIAAAISTIISIATAETVLSGIDRTDIAKVVDRGVIYLFTRSFKQGEPVEKLYNSDSMLFEARPSDVRRPARMLALIQSPKITVGLAEEVKSLAESKLNVSVVEFKQALLAGAESTRIGVVVSGMRWWI